MALLAKSTSRTQLADATDLLLRMGGHEWFNCMIDVIHVRQPQNEPMLYQQLQAALETILYFSENWQS